MPFSLREKSSFFILAILILFHLVLVSLQAPRGNRPSYLERAVFTVFSPLQNGFIAAIQAINNTWYRYFYLRQVEKENRQMREEIFELRQQNLLLRRALEQFNEERKIRDLLEELPSSILTGSVISFDSSNIYKSIVVNRGTANGVKKDMVVLDKRGHLVGRVIEPITSKQARVQLLTDDECGIGVVSAGQKVLGVLSGDSQGKCRMEYVLKTNREISVGEEVLTSGFEGIYPAGLPVGRIISISEGIDLFKMILVEPYFDFFDLDRVAILTFDLREF